MAQTITYYNKDWWAEIQFEFEEKKDWAYIYWELSRWNWEFSRYFKSRMECQCFIVWYMCWLEQYTCEEWYSY